MISFDGVLENPQNWTFDYVNEEFLTYAHDQLFASDALLMGRETYESFAEAWSARAGADDFADRMNSLPKYVASRTQTDFAWNAAHIGGDVVQTVAALKQQSGQNILQYGMGELTTTLLEAGLVDELRFLMYPVVMGSGKRAFEGLDKSTLTLIETRAFSTGVVVMHYAPQGG
jgi:dihydrofolate reductase